jgi:hypothetical protein
MRPLCASLPFRPIAVALSLACVGAIAQVRTSSPKELIRFLTYQTGRNKIETYIFFLRLLGGVGKGGSRSGKEVGELGRRCSPGTGASVRFNFEIWLEVPLRL